MSPLRETAEGLLARILGLSTAKFLDRPVFVVACGRSGSTALHRGLGQHPQVVMAPKEGPLIDKFADTARAFGTSRYCERNVMLSSVRLRRQLRELCYTSALGAGLGVGQLVRRDGPRVLKARSSLHSWGAKVFPDERAAEGLLWLFPEVRFVYLFRNGVDAVQSMSKFGSFVDRSFENRCHFWARHAFRFDYLRRHPSALSVRFEDFVKDSAGVYGRIAEHVGLKPSDAPARFASSTVVHPLDKPTGKGDPREEYARRPPAHQGWSDRERSIFKETCSEAMELLGYEIPF